MLSETNNKSVEWFQQVLRPFCQKIISFIQDPKQKSRQHIHIAQLKFIDKNINETYYQGINLLSQKHSVVCLNDVIWIENMLRKINIKKINPIHFLDIEILLNQQMFDPEVKIEQQVIQNTQGFINKTYSFYHKLFDFQTFFVYVLQKQTHYKILVIIDLLLGQIYQISYHKLNVNVMNKIKDFTLKSKVQLCIIAIHSGMTTQVINTSNYDIQYSNLNIMLLQQKQENRLQKNEKKTHTFKLLYESKYYKRLRSQISRNQAPVKQKYFDQLLIEYSRKLKQNLSNIIKSSWNQQSLLRNVMKYNISLRCSKFKIRPQTFFQLLKLEYANIQQYILQSKDSIQIQLKFKFQQYLSIKCHICQSIKKVNKLVPFHCQQCIKLRGNHFLVCSSCLNPFIQLFRQNQAQRKKQLVNKKLQLQARNKNNIVIENTVKMQEEDYQIMQFNENAQNQRQLKQLKKDAQNYIRAFSQFMKLQAGYKKLFPNPTCQQEIQAEKKHYLQFLKIKLKHANQQGILLQAQIIKTLTFDESLMWQDQSQVQDRRGSQCSKIENSYQKINSRYFEQQQQ